MADQDIFEYQRQQAQQQNNAAVQSQKDAMQRRFAAQGSLNSGAAIKQNQLVEQQGVQNLENANKGINAAQTQQKYQEGQVEKQRQFEAGQAQLGREFTSGEAQKQRQYLTGEREASQGFARGEREAGQNFQGLQADIQRKYMTGERMSSQDYQSAQSALARDLQSSQFDKQIGVAYKGLAQEQWANEQNLDIARQMLAKKDLLEQLLGPQAGPMGFQVPAVLGNSMGGLTGSNAFKGSYGRGGDTGGGGYGNFRF